MDEFLGGDLSVWVQTALVDPELNLVQVDSREPLSTTEGRDEMLELRLPNENMTMQNMIPSKIRDYSLIDEPHLTMLDNQRRLTSLKPRLYFTMLLLTLMTSS